MLVVIAAITGYLAGRMLWLAMRKSWSRPPLMRDNFHGVNIPTGAGFVLFMALVLVEGVRAVVAAAGFGQAPGLTAERASVLIAVGGFTMLGLLDDLIGNSSARGFTGHFRALLRGELTSGAIKVIGGICVALVATAAVWHGDLPGMLLSAGIIALAANLTNLLDLRPGRAIKSGMLATIVLAVGVWFDASLVSLAVVAGAAAALVLDDLHERLMIGDTGANALGAAIGVTLAHQLGSTGRVVAFVLLLALNLASEFVSFTKLFESVAPLRAFDNLGRRTKSRAGVSTIDVRDREGSADAAFGGRRDDGRGRGPGRATVEGAHVGEAAGSTMQVEQDPYNLASSRGGAGVSSDSSRVAADGLPYGSGERDEREVYGSARPTSRFDDRLDDDF